SGQLVAALVAVEATEELVTAANRKRSGAALDGLAQRGPHGRQRRGDQLLLAVLAAADVEEVVLARPHRVGRAERANLQLVPAPGCAPREHGDVAAVGVDGQVVRKEVADDDLHAASSQYGL